MKKQYLYQGWAGNTYSHKCTGNSKVIYYEFVDNIDPPILDIIGIGVSANLKVYANGAISFGTSRTLNYDDVNKFIAGAFMPIELDDIMINSIEEHIEFFNQRNESDIKISDVIKRRLTAEEYWDTTVPNLTFTLGIRTKDYTGVTNREAADYYIKTYEFEPGMTMSEWCNSKYNVDGIQIDEAGRFNAQFYHNGEDDFQMDAVSHLIDPDDNLVDYISDKQDVYDVITGKRIWINFTAGPVQLPG